jgi:hypothetical protein
VSTRTHATYPPPPPPPPHRTLHQITPHHNASSRGKGVHFLCSRVAADGRGDEAFLGHPQASQARATLATAPTYILFRLIFFSNLTPLLAKAKAKELQTSDSDRQWVASEHLGRAMHDSLCAVPPDLRKSRPVYAFSLAVWKVTGRRYLLCGALRFFNDFSVILGPLCLRGLVSTMSPV